MPLKKSWIHERIRSNLLRSHWGQKLLAEWHTYRGGSICRLISRRLKFLPTSVLLHIRLRFVNRKKLCRPWFVHACRWYKNGIRRERSRTHYFRGISCKYDLTNFLSHLGKKIRVPARHFEEIAWRTKFANLIISMKSAENKILKHNLLHPSLLFSSKYSSTQNSLKL